MNRRAELGMHPSTHPLTHLPTHPPIQSKPYLVGRLDVEVRLVDLHHALWVGGWVGGLVDE